MAVDFSEYEHPSWQTAGGTVAGYLLILALFFVVFFVVPWLVFAAL
ncbi:hypothetical protein ACFOZ7_18005 [Natribaculum luteum]|uniref:Halocyanin n=1 Tax=Natribaculum luteum TaxID=1586232 RepID=A0ABD5P3U6_9EURY|nr:hypothetical protein [Natribaculum luteum]